MHPAKLLTLYSVKLPTSGSPNLGNLKKKKGIAAKQQRIVLHKSQLARSDMDQYNMAKGYMK